MDTDGFQFANPIDDLTYMYDTDNKNQLLRVFDATANPGGFKDDTDGTDINIDINEDPDYRYDLNGNMTADSNKGILEITYNHLNLPTEIIFSNGKINYLYNAVGQKVNKKVTQGSLITNTDYLSGFQYKNNFLQFFPHAEGYVNATQNGIGYTFHYVFNFTDHLGNIRLSYSKDPANNVLKIIEENHYYPFGLKHSGYNSDRMMYVKEGSFLKIKPVPPLFKTSYDYRYNSKEYQDELGLNWYDYGWRNYDPAIARWVNIDPLAEQYRRWSPYNYVMNSPMVFVDPDGMSVSYGDFIDNAGDEDDWVKRGGQIFYDSEITSQDEAVGKYGDNAEHLDEGRKLISTTNGEANGRYSYTFHDNGTITDKNGDSVYAKDTFETPGGTTIIGTESGGISFQFSLNGALGGGFGLDFGLVRDSGNNWGFYLNKNINVGFGVDTGFSVNPVSQTHGGPFLLEHYSGHSYSINGGLEAGVGVSGGYGGTLNSNTSALGKFNPLNYGSSDNSTGYTSFSRSLFYGEVTGGAMYRRSKTSVIQF